MRCLGVFLGNHALIFYSCLPIFFTLFLVAALAGDRAENGRRRQDLVEVLKLLAGSLLIAIADGSVVNLFHVWESIDNEGT